MTDDQPQEDLHELLRDRAAFDERIRENALRRHIPLRYREAHTDRAEAIAWVGSPHDALFIYSPVGAGKTYEAWAVAARFIRAEPNAAFYGVRVSEWLHRLRPGGERWTQAVNSWEGNTPARRIDDYELAKQADMLLLDDLGAERLTDWSAEQLTNLIDARYNDKLPTIYTSNLTPSSVADALGQRTASRIAENVTAVPILGEDRRRRQ